MHSPYEIYVYLSLLIHTNVSADRRSLFCIVLTAVIVYVYLLDLIRILLCG